MAVLKVAMMVVKRVVNLALKLVDKKVVVKDEMMVVWMVLKTVGM